MDERTLAWTQNIRDQDQDPDNLAVALMHLQADLTVLVLAPEYDPQVLDILLVVQLPLGQQALEGLVLVLAKGREYDSGQGGEYDSGLGGEYDSGQGK